MGRVEAMSAEAEKVVSSVDIHDDRWRENLTASIAAAIRAARAEERERCAEFIEDKHDSLTLDCLCGRVLADAVREELGDS